jgi:nucleoside diphosphate kinase
VFYKGISIFAGAVFILAGCSTTKKITTPTYFSAQDLIRHRGLNTDENGAKAYIYIWDKKNQHRAAESFIPRQALGQYCLQTGGRFVILYKSHMPLMKDQKIKSTLSKQSNVTQAIGAYHCIVNNKAQWIVSIEPSFEQQINKQGQRAVGLRTQLMTAEEAKRFYAVEQVVKKTVAAKQTTGKKINDTVTSSPVLVQESNVEAEKAAVKVIETPQQQQSRLYVSARRDINAGKNIINACNSAQRAYNYGKLQGTQGTQIYTESGILVARCLTQNPAYATRFSNAKEQAKRILTHLAQNYNHITAKNMLQQIK